MGKVEYHIGKGSQVSLREAEALFESFKKRICDEIDSDIDAVLIIDPNLRDYSHLALQRLGNNNYIFEQKESMINEVVQTRLAAFFPKDSHVNLLFLFTKTNRSPLEFHVKLSEPNNQIWCPDYQRYEANLVTSIIKKNNSHPSSLFVVSGESGIGKSFFVYYVSTILNCTLHSLSYNDVDGENTSVISKNINGFFSKVKGNDIVLVEDADDFLINDSSINHFVKNALVSKFDSLSGITIFIESNKPSSLCNAILKRVSRFILLRPLDDDLRYEYLNYFLRLYAVPCLDRDLFKSYNSSSLSVKDLKLVAQYASIFSMAENPIQFAFDEVNNSKVFSMVSSDSPFMARKPRYKLEDLILPEKKIEEIKYAISLIDNIQLVYTNWNVSSIDPYPRAVLNFYGAPGTGKTMCAHAIANHMNKELLALNYAEIESKYIGDAPKKLEGAFAYARQHNVVMFFDEADSFLGKRIESVSHSADQALNSLRSTMLIQLEMYEGVVIFATNLHENYDKAFKSRFLYEIEFELPNEECRRRLIDNYCGKIIPLKNACFNDEQITMLVDRSAGLSGRELKNAFIQAMNQFAHDSVFNSDKERLQAIIPIDILLSAIDKKVLDNGHIKVKTDVEKTKEAVGRELMSTIQKEKIEEEGDALISISYQAAWADGSITVRENEVISSLKRQYPDSHKFAQEKEPNAYVEDLVGIINKSAIEKKALIWVAKIIYADGAPSNDSTSFFEWLSEKLSINRDLISEIIKYVELEKESTMILEDIENFPLALPSIVDSTDLNNRT